MPLLEAPSCRCPKCCGSPCGQWESDPGWARLAFDWLNASGVAPHAGNRLYNLGEPGGSLIPSLATCPATYLAGMAPDIVLFDLYTSTERGLEITLSLTLTLTLTIALTLTLGARPREGRAPADGGS